MVEGGPTLAAAFLSAGLVDRWLQFVAPLVLGDGAAWPAAAAPDTGDGFTLTRTQRYGADACLVWDRTSFAAARTRLTQRAPRGEA